MLSGKKELLREAFLRSDKPILKLIGNGTSMGGAFENTVTEILSMKGT